MNPSGLLRRRTADAHSELERMGFARRLAAGEIGRTDYADYLRATATLVASLRTEHGLLEARQRDRFDTLARRLGARFQSPLDTGSHRRLAGIALPVLDPHRLVRLLPAVRQRCPPFEDLALTWRVVPAP